VRTQQCPQSGLRLQHCQGWANASNGPKGLRHGFGIHTVVNGSPLHMLQKWTGQALLSTATIYADAIDKEKQDTAAKMWG